MSMGRQIDANQLVGAAEIADRLGVAHTQAIHNWRARYDDFPQPIAVLEAGHIWYWPDIEQWAHGTGRLPADQ
jgi:chromosome partitioning protein